MTRPRAHTKSSLSLTGIGGVVLAANLNKGGSHSDNNKSSHKATRARAIAGSFPRNNNDDKISAPPPSSYTRNCPTCFEALQSRRCHPTDRMCHFFKINICSFSIWGHLRCRCTHTADRTHLGRDPSRRQLSVRLLNINNIRNKRWRETDLKWRNAEAAAVPSNEKWLFCPRQKPTAAIRREKRRANLTACVRAWKRERLIGAPRIHLAHPPTNGAQTDRFRISAAEVTTSSGSGLHRIRYAQAERGERRQSQKKKKEIERRRRNEISSRNSGSSWWCWCCLVSLRPPLQYLWIEKKKRRRRDGGRRRHSCHEPSGAEENTHARTRYAKTHTPRRRSPPESIASQSHTSFINSWHYSVPLFLLLLLVQGGGGGAVWLAAGGRLNRTLRDTTNKAVTFSLPCPFYFAIIIII